MNRTCVLGSLLVYAMHRSFYPRWLVFLASSGFGVMFWAVPPARGFIDPTQAMD